MLEKIKEKVVLTVVSIVLAGALGWFGFILKDMAGEVKTHTIAITRLETQMESLNNILEKQTILIAESTAIGLSNDKSLARLDEIVKLIKELVLK